MFLVINKKNLKVVVALILVSIISLILIGNSGAYNVFFATTNRKIPIYCVKTEEKKVAISFDCAWGVDYTDKLLSIMQEENVQCTFFAVEFWVKAHPDYVKKIVEMGHEIGTHSSTHPYMSKLDSGDIKKELTTSINAIESITNIKVNLFRPPYGDYNNTLIEEAEKLNLYTIQWSVDSLDWKNLSGTEITNRVIKNVKSGSIVLFHNQGLHTSEALPTIIKSLKEKGYTFTKISELIYKDNYKIDGTGCQYLCS